MPDLIVGSVLVVALLSTVTTFSFRNRRVLKDARHQQLALDEVSNQLERLVGLSDEERLLAIANLKLSDPLLNALPQAKLTSELLDDGNGKRIELAIHWNPIEDAVPIRLVGWIEPPLGTRNVP